jgi:hypothetical protein
VLSLRARSWWLATIELGDTVLEIDLLCAAAAFGYAFPPLLLKPAR